MKAKVLGVALLALAWVPAMAQEAFPSRALSVIVPFPQGGVADTTWR
jgi:tripartite-type tricarboxylate transporter receptor subunit TctC